MPKIWGGGTRVPLKEIEGIGPVNARKLKGAGIRSLNDLILRGASPQGRKDIAQAAGFSTTTILEWVNRADLFRVKGIGGEYSDLLEQAGVDTVIELSHRRPDNLYGALAQINETKHLVRRMPTESMVKAWVKQAKTLKRVMEY